MIAAAGFIFITACTSCFHHHDFSVTITDDEDDFEMDAWYNKSRTHAVQVYLNDHLLSQHTKVNKKGWHHDEITLGGDSEIYINSDPGELKIRIAKSGNSDESVIHLKNICEDLKIIMSDN